MAMDNSNIVPITTSLSDYQIPIDSKVRQLLTDQLLPLHKNDADAARLHMDSVLLALKQPPTPSICRVNYCQVSSRDTVMERLRQETLFDGLIGEHTSDDGFGTGDSMIQISIKPHADLTDVIEIHSSCERSTTTSRSSAMKLLSHHSKPPPESAPTLFQNWPRRQAYGWPMTHRVVVCDRFCAEAVLRGAHIFVKGILCADTGIEAGQIVAVYGYVGSDKTKPTQGSTLDQLDIRDTCLFLGLGMTHCDRLQFFSTAGGIGVSMTLHRAAPILPPLHTLGTHVVVQNLPSIVVGHALDPQPGDIILDMCCAPGGKTTHLASLSRGKASIVACDKSRSKVLSVRDFVATMGAAHCVTLLAMDATRIVVDDSDNKETVQQILTKARRSDDGLLEVTGFPAESFDKILLDPPCSALGLRPKLGIRLVANELVKTADYQRLFLQQAIQLLKPGGILTYSTCTINAFENECNVAYVLDKYADYMRLMPLPTEGPGHEGLAGHGLTEQQCLCVRRFDPAEKKDNCIGFFVAKFQKVVG